jgi:hypothetical protein
MRYPFWPNVHSHLDETRRGWKATLSTETKYGTKAQASATGSTTKEALEAAHTKLAKAHGKALRADRRAITKAQRAAAAAAKHRKRKRS